MNQKSDKIVATVFILLSAITNIVSYFYLPEKLIMQIKTDGSAGTTLPTIWGLLIAFVLVVYCIFRFYSAEEKNAKTKFLIGAILIFAADIFTIVYNLMR